MLSILHLSRCTLKSAPSKLLVSNTSLHGRLVSRQLITPVRCYKQCKVFGYKNVGVGRGNKLSNLIKSNGVLARFCSSSPQPKNHKLVGYWLLGCSGMVFTAVVLGMAAGYLLLVYCVYYIVDVVVTSTNGSK